MILFMKCPFSSIMFFVADVKGLIFSFVHVHTYFPPFFRLDAQSRNPAIESERRPFAGLETLLHFYCGRAMSMSAA